MEAGMEARRVAAVAAVWSYLRTGRPAPKEPRRAEAPSAPWPWAQFGRQAQMNQRIQMQARRRK
jgi:hypothetical protein